MDRTSRGGYTAARLLRQIGPLITSRVGTWSLNTTRIKTIIPVLYIVILLSTALISLEILIILQCYLLLHNAVESLPTDIIMLWVMKDSNIIGIHLLSDNMLKYGIFKKKNVYIKRYYTSIIIPYRFGIIQNWTQVIQL